MKNEESIKPEISFVIKPSWMINYDDETKKEKLGRYIPLQRHP